MAVRYSGDVEVRVRYDARRRAYVGIVRGARVRFKGLVHVAPRGEPRASARYDEASEALVRQAEGVLGAGMIGAEHRAGRVVVRRVFRSPCPTESSDVDLGPRRRVRLSGMRGGRVSGRSRG